MIYKGQISSLALFPSIQHHNKHSPLISKNFKIISNHQHVFNHQQSQGGSPP
jgi:hypothetical protein